MAKRKNTVTINHPLYKKAFLYKREDVIYTHIRHENKKIRQSTGLTWHVNNFNLALNLLEKRYLALFTESPQIYDLQELFDNYLDFKKKSVTYSAIKKYRQAWNHWIVYEYTTAEIDVLKGDIVNLIGKSTLHNNTIRKSLQLLSAFFRHAVEMKYIIENPITQSIMPKSKQAEPEQFEKHEITALINSFASGSDMNLLLRLIANTGMRIAEAISLTKDNFTDGWITFVGKGSNKRAIPVMPGTELSLISEILSPRKKTFIWMSPTTPHHHLKTACNKLKIVNKGFHGIRRYFENTLLDAGANSKSAADILGHTLQIQDKHYRTRSKKKNLQEAMETLSKN